MSSTHNNRDGRSSSNDDCKVCIVYFTSSRQYHVHFSGKQHRIVEILQSLNIKDYYCQQCGITREFTSNSHCKVHYYSSEIHIRLNTEIISREHSLECDLCGVESFPRQRLAQQHFSSADHLYTAELHFLKHIRPAIDRKCTVDDVKEEAFFLTQFIPRGYQVELFARIYNSSNTIFLPTGTGKNFCAAMLISFMLRHNPYRSVLVLVDTVMLALQQKKFLEDQLLEEQLRVTLKHHENDPNVVETEVCRFDTEHTERTVIRHVEIGCVYGDSRPPLYMYDVIVTTAEYFLRIEDKLLKCSNFSLVVVDGAHHCDKDHPFNKFLTTQHKKLQVPQILGLTASERETDQNTKNLSDAKITIVKHKKDELTKYKSSATLKIEILSPIRHI